MNYSFSTVLMTILTSNLLIAVLVLCFRNRKIMLSLGYKLLILFLTLTAVRFLIPFEFPFSRNVYFPEWLSAIVVLVRHPFISIGKIQISVTSLFGVVWLGGTIYYIYRFYKRKESYRHYVVRYGTNRNRQEPYRSIMEEIGGKKRNSLWVVTAPFFGAPMQYGTLRPYIVLPSTLELSEEELYYVLRHETAHFYHHDAFIKDAIGIIRAVYWWNPLGAVLEKKSDILLEMRVDDKLVRGDAATREAYCNVLNRISEKIQVEEETPVPGAGAAISMAAIKGEDLKYRQKMMVQGKQRKGLSFYLTAAVVIAVYIFSYCFTFEAYYAGEIDAMANVSREGFIAIQKEDGTYDVYFEDSDNAYFLENIDSLEHYINITIRAD